MTKRRILIADESAAYRHQLRLAIESIEGLSVVGEASTDRNALQFLGVNQVDCLIVFSGMSGASGLDVVREARRVNATCRIMVLAPPALVNAITTKQALNAGANEFVGKPAAEARLIRGTLEPKLVQIFNSGEGSLAPTLTRAVDWRMFRPKLIVVGSSTGGPATLEKFLGSINGPLICPVIIVQHSPAKFTTSLAERLTEVTKHQVIEAKHGQTVSNKQILLAPGDFHLRLKPDKDGAVTVVLDQGENRNFVRPAVDHLFESAAAIYGTRCLGIVLTGMGQDGLEGARAIKAHGGAVVIQDKQSSVVFGMPAAVMAGGYQDFVGDPNAIGGLLNRIAG